MRCIRAGVNEWELACIDRHVSVRPLGSAPRSATRQRAISNRSGTSRGVVREQAVLRVHESAIQAAIAQPCAGDRRVRVVRGEERPELVTDTYLSSLSQNAQELARTRGRVTTAELSSRFDLPPEVSACPDAAVDPMDCL